MRANLRRELAAVALGLVSALPLWAEQPKKQPTPARPREERKVAEEGDRPRFLERFGRFRALDKHERDHETVRGAFRDVVTDSHKATVRILCDDKAAALGSIVDSDGYILTKASELKGRLAVKLHDNRLFEAKLVGLDRKTDLAMLKIEAKDLPVVSWREAADVPGVGTLLASSGLETLPVAIGVVSVQPRLIAAPSGILGVVLEDGDNAPRVAEVMSNSGAQKAGIKPGDHVLALNGQAVKNREELVEKVRQFPPGDQLTLTIKRGADQMDIAATLGQRPTSPDSERKDFQNTLGGPLSERRAGFPLALQHDTVLTPQDCGGPLVDLDGRCVGINIARAGRVNSYALPTSVVLPLLAEFKAGKYAPAPSPDEVKRDLVKRFEELKQSESSLAEKLARAIETIGKLQSGTEENRDELIKKAEADRAATETELTKVKAELSKLESQKTSLER
jgi:serine protease Do